MSAPIRVQLRRTKGWRMPENTVRVSRPSQWGNPFNPIDTLDAFGDDKALAVADAVRCFRALVETRYHEYPEWWERLRRLHGTGRQLPVDIIRHDLRGKNLACWCSLSEPCHADVLLEVANA